MKPADAPTREQFAKKFLKEMKRIRADENLFYDMKRFAILRRGSDLEETSLGNFYDEYVTMNPAKRTQFITQVVESMLAAKGDLPRDFNMACDRLRPRLWLRSVVASTLLRAQIEEGPEAVGLDLPDSPIGAHLISTIVYDLSSAVRSLPRAQFTEWGVTYEEGLKIASENLSRAPFKFATLPDGIYFALTGDNYDAARLLLPDLLERWKVDGDPIAMVPNRNVLFMTGSNNAVALKVLVQVVAEALKEPRPLSGIPLRWNGTAWEDWIIPRNHTVYSAFHDMEVRFLASEYHQHDELVQQHLRLKNSDAEISPCQAANAGQGLFSTAFWLKGVKCLLPKVDRLSLFVGDIKEPKLVAFGRWERIQEICGHIFKVTEYYPPRYLVEDFPTDDEIREIGVEKL